MMQDNKRIGIDVGGSHVAAGLIDIKNQRNKTLNLIEKDINAMGSAYNIIETIGNCIKEMLIEETNIDAVGIAFPGPFDYEKGVSVITNVGGKFE